MSVVMAANFPPGLFWVDDFQSSNVKRVAYDLDTRRLYVDFHTGNGGYHIDVPESVYDAFLRAPSKGQFYARVLRTTQRKPGSYIYYRL